MLQVKKEPRSPFIPKTHNPIFEKEANTFSPNKTVNEIVKRWIKSSPLNQVIKERCEQLFKENEERVMFEFTIPINIMDLLDFDALVGDFAIKETRNFICALRKVMFDIIQEDKWLQLSQESQILIFPQISNLPAFSDGMNRIPTKEKLVKIIGTVISVTSLLQYTKGVKYNCTEEECPFFTGNENVLVWLPGTSESSLVRSDYTCSCCCSYLQEDVAHRNIGEKRVIKVILNDGMECLQTRSNHVCSRQQAFTVILREDLKNRVDFGVKYWITGVVVQEMISQGQSQQYVHAVLEAFNIEEIHSSIISKHLLEEELPSSIKTLYEDRASSPWSFVASLAYCFGETISVNGSYNRLKMALLLSLAMLGDNISIEDVDGKLLIGKDLTSLHIFAAAEDILTIQRLQSYASAFAERCCPAQTGIGIFGDVTKHSPNKRFFVDGGSLLLSGRHVCTIPNITALKKDDVERLQKVLETKEVVFNIPKKASDQSDVLQMSFPLQSTVWAAADSASLGKNSLHKWRPMLENFDLVNNFSDEHGIPDDIEEDNVQEILKRAMGIEKESDINDEDFLKFIKFARTRRVNFSENASKILKSFFLASRRARGTGIIGVQISQRSLQTLLSLAAAHAKLSLRREVLVEDALVSILLYEESITMRYGYSVMDIQPKLHFSRRNFAAHLGPRNDEWMRSFHRQVSNFCKTYSTGLRPGLYRAEE